MRRWDDHPVAHAKMVSEAFTLRSHLTIILLLFPLYAAFGVACYWLFVDTKPPMVVKYQHSHFLSHPALTRAEAETETMQVKEVIGGTTLWLWRELCWTKPIHGEGGTVWNFGSYSSGGPQRTVPNNPGCTERATSVDVPMVPTDRDAVYEVVVSFDVNPLTTVLVEYPPVHLRILAGTPTHGEPDADDRPGMRGPKGVQGIPGK